MSTSALVMMIAWCGLVTIMTGYFFYRVLTTKARGEEDPEDIKSDTDK